MAWAEMIHCRLRTSDMKSTFQNSLGGVLKSGGDCLSASVGNERICFLWAVGQKDWIHL